MVLKLSFLGAAGTVTGSKYLVENGASRLDCALNRFASKTGIAFRSNREV